MERHSHFRRALDASHVSALASAIREFARVAVDSHSLLAGIARQFAVLLTANALVVRFGLSDLAPRSVRLASSGDRVDAVRASFDRLLDAEAERLNRIFSNGELSELDFICDEIARELPAKDAQVVALFSGSGLLGFVLLVRVGENERPFEDAELALANELAAAASVALESSTLQAEIRSELDQRRRMADRLRVLAQASRDFSSASADYHALLDVVASTVGNELGELCTVRLISPDGQWLRLEDASVFHRDPEWMRQVRHLMLETPQRAGEGIAGAVISSREPLLLSVAAPADFHSRVHSQYHDLLRQLDITHVLAVPIESRRRCLGVLTLSRKRSSTAYDSNDLHLARDLADRAGLAIENAQLMNDLAHRLSDNKRAEEKFAGLLESAPDAIVIVDHAGKIVLVNAQTEVLFGYARDELLGQQVERLLPQKYRAQHPGHRAGYFGAPRLRHAMAADIDLFGLRQDGSEFSAEISLSPINTPEGQLVIAVIRDISERKRLEELRALALDLEIKNRRISEASRLKSEFLANMSHELRTPLNAIIGFSTLMHAGKAGSLSPTQTEYLGDILASSRHLLHLINDVLDLAKVEAGRIEIQPESVDLQRVASEVRDILRGLAAEKQISLTFEVESELEVVTDARLLKQILYNYVSNAIKFTPDRGHVRINIAGETPHTFVIRVQDNGIGIRPEDLGRLFVEFQQLDAGASKKYPGTGLGLALTKRIVEAQAGSVNVNSVLGQGSTFLAELPRRPEI